MHRALVIGAGRIGAGYKWDQDLAYTHAGAYQALRDRVELVGFIEPDNDRATEAKAKWNVPVYEDIPIGIQALRPDIVSICVQPEQQNSVYLQLDVTSLRGIWQEKPFVAVVKEWPIPIQVNYMRRGDDRHRALVGSGGRLIVYGKDDIHTRCHFDDLAKWWNAELDYRVFNGPCAYFYHPAGAEYHDEFIGFDNGGVDGGKCFKAMLGNLLDHVDNGTPLWSPAT